MPVRAEKLDHESHSWSGGCVSTRELLPSLMVPHECTPDNLALKSAILDSPVACAKLGCMSIIVVCPGCRKSFKVNDKFAGKSGPCPNCKRTLHVPEKSEEVKVHAPTEFAGGGRTKTGKLAIEPVAFTPARLQPVTAVLMVAAVLIVLAVAWAGGRTRLFESLIATTIGLLVVSPPLVVAAYTVLRNDELEPYRGKELYIRSSPLCPGLRGPLGRVQPAGLPRLDHRRVVDLALRRAALCAGRRTVRAGRPRSGLRRLHVPLRLLSPGDRDPPLGGGNEMGVGRDELK